MPRKPSQARNNILKSALELIRESGVESLTVEGTADRAGVAKGLVHYHFKTKQGLLTAAIDELASQRGERWSRAFEANSPQEVVDQTWELLTSESDAGITRAWHSLVGVNSLLTDRSVKGALDLFTAAIGRALSRMLARRMGLETTVPESEIGLLLTAVIDGMSTQLMAGGSEEELHGAYAAAWLGVLSLTRPTG